MSSAVLSRDALNRALLARQLLLERSSIRADEALRHLVGLQAQIPDTPYVGLWSRVQDFHFEDLADLVDGRAAVRLVMMRSTIHLVTAADAVQLRPVLQPMLEHRFQSSPFAKALAGADLEAIVEAAREALEQRPLTFDELGKLLAAQWPERDPNALAQVARTYLHLVQTTPRGLWGRSGAARHTTTGAWLGLAHPAYQREPASVRDFVGRYLAAFGPASVADIRTWSGLTRLRPIVESLGLVALRDEEGTELWDLPDAPRPDPLVAAPVRFLPAYDNILLAHVDRRRILGTVELRNLTEAYRIIPGTVLVNGYVAGAWRLGRGRDAANLQVQPVAASFPRQVRAAIVEEGERLLEAMGRRGHLIFT